MAILQVLSRTEAVFLLVLYNEKPLPMLWRTAD